MARLKEFYRETVVPKLKQDLGVENAMQVPKHHQDHGEHGRGRGRGRPQGHGRRGRRSHQDHGPEAACSASRRSRSRRSSCARACAIGCKVTLRGERMYEFLDRLISIAMPRIRDFRGVIAALVRRPRQLQPRHQGTDHFPRDPVRPDRPAPGHGHHDHDDGEGQQAGPSTARGIQLPVPEVRNHRVWPRRTWSSARSVAPRS